MTKEDKDLLLKDLCGRLPYGVKIHIGKTQRIEVFSDINLRIGSINNTYADIKPYLFLLSSMTEEQCEKFKIISGWDGEWEDIKRGKFSCIGYIGLDYIYDTIDWLNKNHFDYRGLIEKSLALDATELNIY